MDCCAVWGTAGFTFFLRVGADGGSMVLSFFFQNGIKGHASFHEQRRGVVGPVGPDLRAKKLRPEIVGQQLFQRLAVLLVYGQEEQRQHHRHHAQGGGGVAAITREALRERHADEHRCAKADKLPFGQVEEYFGLDPGQVPGDRDIGGQRIALLSMCVQDAKHSSTVYPTMLQMEPMASTEIATIWISTA